MAGVKLENQFDYILSHFAGFCQIWQGYYSLIIFIIIDRIGGVTTEIGSVMIIIFEVQQVTE